MEDLTLEYINKKLNEFNYLVLFKNTFPFFLLLFYFIFPINLYIIGDYQGFGYQTVFFRYNFSNMGVSLITWIRDIEYIFLGLLTPKTNFSIALWGLGVVISTIGLIMSFCTLFYQNKNIVQRTGIFLMIGGFLFLFSIISQYSLFLSSSSGIAFPVGIPVIFLFSVLLLKIDITDKVVKRN
ncbi:hypothetical protein KSK55_15980 [Methanospirillum purgamenti]|jgi:hypothetical protein|uniref:Uncharacterized protein n=1 Tax=Methanospirillum hungatei TaxID=2203 RepID=A0A8F5ZEH2_METHU|nr:hypothetical protein [Methanospirillum hungatei]QXO94782.1 hypothetical protein KSK55_15980 [Methanospirillum hungatei]